MRVLGLVLCALLIPLAAGSWGFYGHKRINRMAVFTLPSELMGFYKAHLEYITEHAVDPDKRRYVLEEEGPRHYIDIDHYGKVPFKQVPRRWSDAVELLCEDTLKAYGIVPWHVNLVYHGLVKAFEAKDWPEVLKRSADLGHYVADAHVPLHTTENYNGQLTGQHGIHALWESRLPERYAEDYDYFVGKARYVPSPLNAIWDAVEASHRAVDSVLGIERALTLEFKESQKYTFEERGTQTVKTYSEAFTMAYHSRLNGMVERRMRSAITMVGSFWYTAWLEAGKPDWQEVLISEQELPNTPEPKSAFHPERDHDH